MLKNKLTKDSIFSIITASFLVLAHIAIILAVAFSYRYFGIYPSLFGSIVAIVICILIIIDIVFFVGFNHKDLALKIITCVLAVFLLAGGTVGTYYIAKVNGAIGGILDDGSEEKYETYSGSFICYKPIRNFDSLEGLKNKKVGMLNETSNGLTYIAKSIMDEQGFDYAVADTYTNTTELLQALIDGEIDAAVVTSAYKSIYQNDENSNMKDYLDDFSEIYSFEKDLKVVNNKTNKNLMKDPFNVLLIGWSRTELGSTVGLADAIIVATINPQTYTVSMMSIARDSFVPIACYGGAYDKINSGRSTSRACFIETVENFIGMDIDYYMEADYEAIVYIVNTLGGVEIDNPVDFELDGVFVPAGKYVAEGWQALEFCRERHHMPNGDFDRQKHQKEVIMAIARKLIESGDVNLGIDCLRNASPFMDTDFTLQELSTVFNLLLNTKNYTSLDTFDLVDFHTLRITGEGGIMYYSYSMHLPLWVYLIYQGSYDESIGHIYDVLGKHNAYEQDYSFEFSGRAPYVRVPFYSTDYESKFLFTPEPMPAYWPTLTGMNVTEAYEWANTNGVVLTIENILPGDQRYNAEMDGQICGQSVKYGSLVSENKTGTVTIMGTGLIDENKVVPYFEGHNYTKAIDWAESHGIGYSIVFDINAGNDYDICDVVSQNPKAYTSIDECETLQLVVRAGQYHVIFNGNEHGNGLTLPDEFDFQTGDKKEIIESLDTVVDNDVTYMFGGWYTTKSCEVGTRVRNTRDINTREYEDGSTIQLFAKWTKLINVTFDYGDTTKIISTQESFPDDPVKVDYVFNGWYTHKNGAGTRIYSFDEISSNITLYAYWTECTHEWSEWSTVNDPTCSSEGLEHRICNRCGKEETNPIDMLTGDACVIPEENS